MKLQSNYIYFLLILSSFTFASCSSPTESDALNQSYDLDKTLETMAIEELSPAEEEGLLFLREEEKLARDVYITLYEKWELTVFNNISKSEQKHTDAIKLLLDRYELDDPMMEDVIGIFKNEDLQNLYNSLVEKGNESIEEALKVGGAIEEIDILDLELQINEKVDNEDIKFVYSNLLRGSKNHIRAFVRNIENYGFTYEPQYMTPEAYQIIIESDMERGGRGKGKRRGRHGNG
ncbi:MAG: DUF2202 domain-containing protein [Bacteroidota bacterium]